MVEMEFLFFWYAPGTPDGCLVHLAELSLEAVSPFSKGGIKVQLLIFVPVISVKYCVCF